MEPGGCSCQAEVVAALQDIPAVAAGIHTPHHYRAQEIPEVEAEAVQQTVAAEAAGEVEEVQRRELLAGRLEGTELRYRRVVDRRRDFAP